MTNPPRAAGRRALAMKLVRFLVVGGGGALAYAGLCTLLVARFPDLRAAISIGVHASLVPLVYLAQSRLTFESGGVSVAEFLRYGLLQLVSIALSTWLLVRLVTESELLNLIVFLGIAATAALISFAVCNVFVFRGPPPDGGTRKPGTLLSDQ